ncbi:MAG TPA: NADH-quinone oxidoreductase subunit NuoG [Gammaproteobacteria bacterium]|nr:NADH-quinone oxidoreductase subunit NuoG [Gammaproteobacteria bacterium]
MATIFVDNQPFEVNPDNNLLHECLSLDFDLPYFCWHPAMHSVGACRQCAVTQYKDENDEHGRIVMACMTPAADGTRIALKDEQSRTFRKTIIEWLMLNHPHDCPVCEEGGECHLQDMTVMAGHSFRRTRFPKRTYRNQNLGPCINHEMNRCIQCYRCVRFYEYAGGHDLEAFHIHDNVYFGRAQDGTLENEFSGNLAEVCPTGVFTDKTLGERYTRKWDLRATPSICHHCSLGCNISPGERYGELRRIINRYNRDVNGYFICDRGRYGYQFVNSPARIRRSRFDGEELDHDDALARLATLTVEPRRLVGIGSPRASLEANFALRTLVGADRFSHGMSKAEAGRVRAAAGALENGKARIATLKETESADAVLILGEDVPNTAPRLALALRQSARSKSYAIAREIGVDYWHDASVRDIGTHSQSPFFIATPGATRLDDVASEALRLAPQAIARLGFAIAHAINADAPDVADLDDEERATVDRIAAVLTEAERPLVVSGTGSGSGTVIDAAANIADALAAANPQTMLSMVVPECNSVGAYLIGGRDIEDALEAIRNDEADTLVILENDLFRRADSAAVIAALDAAAYVIVLDSIESDTIGAADLVLATGTFAEADGTLVNNEGRAQRFFRLFEPQPDIHTGWEWLRDALRANGRNEVRGWHNLDLVTVACAQALPALAGIEQAAVSSDYRVAQMKAAREPARYSGRTAMLADRTIHEPPPPEDADSALGYSMEGYQGAVPGSIQPFFWAAGWNSNQQAVNKFQDEIAGLLVAGQSGRRLLEPRGSRAFADNIPGRPGGHAGEWLALPLHHVFGSEELSRHSPALQARAPEAHVAVNEQGAARLGIATGALVEVTADGASCRLPLHIAPDLPDGTIGVLGAPPFAARLPAPVSIREAAL